MLCTPQAAHSTCSCTAGRSSRSCQNPGWFCYLGDWNQHGVNFEVQLAATLLLLSMSIEGILPLSTSIDALPLLSTSIVPLPLLSKNAFENQCGNALATDHMHMEGFSLLSCPACNWWWGKPAKIFILCDLHWTRELWFLQTNICGISSKLTHLNKWRFSIDLKWSNFDIHIVMVSLSVIYSKWQIVHLKCCSAVIWSYTVQYVVLWSEVT